MCGIVGYIGHQKSLPILIEGLRRLEYRGYDSAGCAVIENGEFQILRAEGKLHKLVERVQKLGSEFQATIGIGHTRWATHGKPNEQNAHPHHSKDFVLVHNGIIENHMTLKSELLEKGHQFQSETDTEVVCYLLQDHFEQGLSVFDSLCKTIAKIKGAFSLVISHRQDPTQIYVAKKGSPLVVGLKEGENFVASDIPALLPYTRDVVFLEDGEMAVLKSEGVKFYNFSGDEIQKPVHKIQWTMAQAEKGGFKHFMLKEIFEQPRVIADSLMGRISENAKRVELPELDPILKKFAAQDNFRLKIVACGTSYHAGLVAKYWIESLAKTPVDVELASEFRYREPLIDEKTLVIPITQSGETADTLAAVMMCLEKKSHVLAVCNVLESSVPRKAHETLYTHAGPEVGVASTKAFTTQLLVLYLLTLKLAEIKNTLSSDEIKNKVRAVLKLSSTIDSFLKSEQTKIKSIADMLAKKDRCYFLGRGVQYPIVLEGALKLKEISYIHAEGYAGGEMKHGPIALIEEGVPVIGVALQDKVYEKSLSNLQEVESRGAHVVALISKGDEALKNQFPYWIEIPKINEDLDPFLTTIPLQLLSYFVADKKGTDVDQPRNLAKSVTVE